MDYFRKFNLENDLRNALRNGQDVILSYQGQNSPTTLRRVTPQTVSGGSSGYVNGFCHLRGEPRTFSFDGVIDYLFVDRPTAPVQTLEQQALEHMGKLGLNTGQASFVGNARNVFTFYSGDTLGNNVQVRMYALDVENGVAGRWSVAID